MSLLDRYDAEEREHAVVLGMQRQALPGLVRYVDLVGHSSVVLYSRLDASSIDMAIEDQAAYFEQLGHELEWKAFQHDEPADLLDRLRAQNFNIDEREAIMVLDLAQANLGPPSHAVRRIDNEQDLHDTLTRIREGRDDLVQRLTWEMQQAPEQLSVYVAEVDGEPVSSGWVRFPTGTSFASLWGGATLPIYRGRGLYTDLVRARVEEARQRGYAYATVDAGSMSQPILERRGFQVLTWATACTRPAPAPR